MIYLPNPAHIPDESKPTAPSHFIETKKKTLRPYRPRQLRTLPTTEWDEFKWDELRSAVSWRLSRFVGASHHPRPSQPQRKMEHPRELNFEVICQSGMILTDSPSIVETTDVSQRGWPLAADIVA
jgi:hypothetical protein